MNKRGLRWIKNVTIGSVAFAALLVAAFLIANQLSPLKLDQQFDHATTVFSRDRDVLRQFSNRQGVFRIPIQHQVKNGHVVRPVSQAYLDALIEYEDKYFYHHPGVNPFSLLRAIGQQLIHGRIISGGSTLTMQVARMLYPYQRSYQGKVVQIFRALQLEQALSKEQILDLYLSYTPMGGNIEGVEAGAQRYFGKSAADLTTSEAVLLVVLPQRPSATRPDKYPKRALVARNKVLVRTQRALQLNDHELSVVLNTPLNAKRYYQAQLAPLLARRVKSLSGPTTSTTAEIATYIDHTLQSEVELLIEQNRQHWPSALSSAILVMDNRTGEVLAYKGSANFTSLTRYGHVDMVQALRSPGSTLKPFIYALAMDKHLVHSASLLMDVPMRHGKYQAQNFNRHFSGPIRLDEALQLSKNAPVVQVLHHVGADTFLTWLQHSQIALQAQDANLTLALGGLSVNLEGLVSLYSSLARQGESITPRFLSGQAKQTHTLLSKESSWIIFDILSRIPPPDRVSPAHHRAIAWKTGTSAGFRDAWSIGVSRDYTIGVWIGRPDGAPNVGKTGASLATPLMFDVFDLLPADAMRLHQPKHVTQGAICWPSGLAADLIAEQNCLFEQKAWLINQQAAPTLRSNEGISNLHNWPAPLIKWAQTKGVSLNRRGAPTASSQPISILKPKSGSQFFPYPGQQLKLKASHPQVQWYLNEQPIHGQSLSLDQLNDGEHLLTACTESCDSSRFFVYK